MLHCKKRHSTNVEKNGLILEAIAWYERAAEVAQQMHANLEAIHLADRALHLLHALPEDHERQMHQVELGRHARNGELSLVSYHRPERLRLREAKAILLADKSAITATIHHRVNRFIIFIYLLEFVSSNLEVLLPPSAASVKVTFSFVSPPHLSEPSGCSPPDEGSIASRRSTSAGQSRKLCASPLTMCCTLPCHSLFLPYLRSGVWQLGKKVLALILAVCPLVEMFCQRK